MIMILLIALVLIGLVAWLFLDVGASSPLDVTWNPVPIGWGLIGLVVLVAGYFLWRQSKRRGKK